MTDSLSAVEALSPQIVWRHFARFCRTPRPSKHEEQIRAALLDWAKSAGIEAFADKVGNVIMKKPATPGYENAPAVLLQGHIDMVCQKNNGIEHDFLKDPIEATVENGRVVAKKTTLGADNGIGCALALAALEDPDLGHGPLEVLLTIDEEEGMFGAKALEPGLISARLLINLDSDNWGEFCLGCAGGMDVWANGTHTSSDAPIGTEFLTLSVTGMKGGHSGTGIHRGRGNAVKSLTRILLPLVTDLGAGLCSFSGGTARNAIPREAVAVVAVSADKLAAAKESAERTFADIASELSITEPDAKLTVSSADKAPVIDPKAALSWLHAVNAAPHGVIRTDEKTGEPQTSNNLASMSITSSTGNCSLMPRSTIESAKYAITSQITSAFALAGLETSFENIYPGWRPDYDGDLLAKTKSAYRDLFGTEPKTYVIHAGLECGILINAHPGMQAISFGPDIFGPHAPGESVDIASVGECWKFLRKLLSSLK